MAPLGQSAVVHKGFTRSRRSRSLVAVFSRGSPRSRAGGVWLLDVLRRARDSEESQQQTLEIEPERPVLDVVVVPLDPVREGCLAAQAVHLGPAGDPRLDTVPVRVAVDVLLEEPNELGALWTRPDQAHLALQHVDQLRQFV